MLGFLVNKIISGVNAAVVHNVSDGQGRGWGDSIEWKPIYSADKEQVVSGKPIMLIVHKMTCPGCIALKAKFSADTVIPELSQNFVMVNATPDDVQSFLERENYKIDYMKLQPDGKYVPRIMFYFPKWGLLDLTSNAAPGNKYYYGNSEEIRNQMRRCINMLK